ncbi:MAG: hypothetical protein JWQ82_840, partial [Tardiphaga sp.]|nr:hypothetical protein [Tardiphaga sp.]
MPDERIILIYNTPMHADSIAAEQTDAIIAIAG